MRDLFLDVTRPAPESAALIRRRQNFGGEARPQVLRAFENVQKLDIFLQPENFLLDPAMPRETGEMGRQPRVRPGSGRAAKANGNISTLSPSIMVAA